MMGQMFVNVYIVISIAITLVYELDNHMIAFMCLNKMFSCLYSCFERVKKYRHIFMSVLATVYVYVIYIYILTSLELKCWPRPVRISSKSLLT